MNCGGCGAADFSDAARRCTKFGAQLEVGERSRAGAVVRIVFIPLKVIARVISYPSGALIERRRWLREAASSGSPIDSVSGLADSVRGVYRYICDVILRFGAANSRIRTIAKAAGISGSRARFAIRELERRGLLSHRRRVTWRACGTTAYFVGRVRQERSR